MADELEKPSWYESFEEEELIVEATLVEELDYDYDREGPLEGTRGTRNTLMLSRVNWLPSKEDLWILLWFTVILVVVAGIFLLVMMEK